MVRQIFRVEQMSLQQTTLDDLITQLSKTGQKTLKILMKLMKQFSKHL